MPHTLTYAITLKLKLDSLNDIPKDKKPARGLLDKPHQLEDYLDRMYSTNKTPKESEFVEFDIEEAE